MNMYREMIQNPEQDTEPPEDFYITADCGHEVYQGQGKIEYEGKYICPDCFTTKVLRLLNDEEYGIYDLAEAMQLEVFRLERKHAL